MALITKDKTEVKKPKNVVEFSKHELEFLLSTIANSTFEGKDVQLVYETAVKIQKQIMEM